MPTLISKTNALTFDDVLLVPQHSDVASRKNLNISTTILGKVLQTPLCSANMDTVTEVDMAILMDRMGGFGILHRYASPTEILSWIKTLKEKNVSLIVPSIGVKETDLDLAVQYVEAGADAVCVDIAHGDSKHMVDMVVALKQKNIKVIAGNVCTYDGAQRLAMAGADAIKVGVGPGSMCTTRIVTGHGVPQLSAIEDVARLKKGGYKGAIIADGGIRNSGDCVKALAFGADLCMLGSMLAGTDETPGEAIFSDEHDKRVKAYRGMASAAARSSVAKIDKTYTPEGESTFIACKGSAENIIHNIVGGIKSGFSYSGATNLSELHENAAYVMITTNGIKESHPHGVTP